MQIQGLTWLAEPSPQCRCWHCTYWLQRHFQHTAVEKWRQISNPVSRATQGRATQGIRAHGCSFIPSRLHCRWASAQRWNQSRTHAYPQPSVRSPCGHTEQISQTQMLFFLHPPKPWKVPKIPLPSGGQIFYTTLLSPGPTTGAGNGSTDCSGPFDTQPWKLLTDQQPGE